MADCAEIMYNFINKNNGDNNIYTINGPLGYDFKEIIRLVNKVSGKQTVAIPLPKFIMYFLKNIITIFRLKLGIVPDQIDRLYCEKETAFLEYNFTTLENYIKKKTLEMKDY
jgi:hypothetical protein